MKRLHVVHRPLKAVSAPPPRHHENCLYAWVGPSTQSLTRYHRAALPPRSPGRTRLILVSDTHGRHRELGPLPAGDVLLHAGDVLKDGYRLSTDDAAAACADFDDWLESSPCAERVWIAGNHDAPMRAMGAARVQALVPSGTYLCHSVTFVAGLRVFGSPFSPPGQTRNTAFQCANALQRAVDCDVAADVLLTHAPPTRSWGRHNNFTALVRAAAAARSTDDRRDRERSSQRKISPRGIPRGLLPKEEVPLVDAPRLRCWGHLHHLAGTLNRVRSSGALSVCACSLDVEYQFHDAPVVVLDLPSPSSDASARSSRAALRGRRQRPRRTRGEALLLLPQEHKDEEDHDDWAIVRDQTSAFDTFCVAATLAEAARAASSQEAHPGLSVISEPVSRFVSADDDDDDAGDSGRPGGGGGGLC